MKSTTAVKDPVCGMDVATATAAGPTEYKGLEYYFCGSKCKEQFALDPEQYLGKSGGERKSGHGCCGQVAPLQGASLCARKEHRREDSFLSGAATIVYDETRVGDIEDICRPTAAAGVAARLWV